MPMPERDAAQRKADMEWLYRNERSAEDRSRAMDEAEMAELRRRAAAKAAADPLPPLRAPAAFASTPSTPRTPILAASSAAVPPAPTLPPATAGLRNNRRKRRRHRGHTIKAAIALVVVLVVGYVGWLAYVPAYAWSTMTHVGAFPSGSRPAPQPGTAILLVGSDARQGLTAAQRKQLGTGWDLGARTDTMMIMYVPPSGRSVLLSLPRDSYVPIPGHGHDKLNAAFSIGGPQLLIRTVEQDTGIRIDGYLEVGMGGFADVIESIGGIRMCLPQPMVDKDSHTNLPAGCQTLTGPEALGYVRMRKADPLGDLGRVKRQRAMIDAVAKKAASPSILLDPLRYWQFAMASRNSLRSDGVGVLSLPGLGSGLMDLAGGKGLQLTVPVSNPNAMTPAGSSVLWDEQAAKNLFHSIATGNTAGLEKYAK